MLGIFGRENINYLFMWVYVVKEFYRVGWIVFYKISWDFFLLLVFILFLRADIMGIVIMMSLLVF